MIGKQGVSLLIGKQGVQVKTTLNPANETVARGIYDATTLSAVDADLAVGNIKKDENIFGKVGTFEGAAPTLTKILNVALVDSGNLSETWVDKQSVSIPAEATSVIMSMDGKAYVAEWAYLRGLYNGVERVAEFSVTEAYMTGILHQWSGDGVGSAADAKVQAKEYSETRNRCYYSAIFWYVS